MPLVRSHVALVALLAALVSTPLAAQMPGLQARPYPLGKPLPSSLVNVLEYRPPLQLQPRTVELRSLFTQPTVVTFLIPGHSFAEQQALALVRESAGWKRLRLVIVARALSLEEAEKIATWVRSNAVAAPVILDGTLEIAIGLGALRLPSYAIVDAGAVPKVRGIGSRDANVAVDKNFNTLLAEIEAGAEVPMVDGELKLDTRTLVGTKPAKITLQPAPYSPLQEPRDLGGAAVQKPTLVVFWMATCPHCQREMPRINTWMSKHKGEVDLVTITRTDNAEIRNRTVEYLKSHGLEHFPVYAGDPAVYREYRVEGIPTWAMLAPGGKLVAAAVGEDPQLMKKLDEALAAAR